MKKFLIILTIIFCPVAFANDTLGSVAAGGIQFIKTSSIQMMSEELSISPTDITVEYLFKNLSDKPISATVYFPLPPHQFRNGNTISWDDEVSGVKNVDKAPLRNFTVEVNGQRIKCQLLSRAILDGKDITHTLLQAGIPLNTELVANGYTDSEEDLDEMKFKEWQKKAKKLGLLDAKNKPLWQKQILFSWQQIFPAHQTIKVKHNYKPATGYAFSTDIKSALEDFISAKSLSTYAHFSSMMNWSKTIQHEAGEPFTFYNVKYILTTGANWAGPIEKFTLNLLYPPQGTAIYNHFYKSQIAKIIKSNKKTQIIIHNFVPSEDLNIVFAATAQLGPNPNTL